MKRIAIIIIGLWALLAGGVWAEQGQIEFAESWPILAQLEREPVVFSLFCKGVEIFRVDEEIIVSHMTKQEVRDMLLIFSLGFQTKNGEIACPLAKKLLPRFLQKGGKKK